MKDYCRIVLPVWKSGKDSESMHGMFSATFATVPVFLLDDTEWQVPLEDGFAVGADSYSLKGEELSLTTCLTEVSLIDIHWT